MATTGSELFQELLSVVPDFKPVYDEHLSQYNELLSHVLMADFMRWFVRVLFQEQKEFGQAEATLRKAEAVLCLLEREFTTGAEEVRNVIAVSFLENLWQADQMYPAIRAVIARKGPNLLGQLTLME